MSDITNPREWFYHNEFGGLYHAVTEETAHKYTAYIEKSAYLKERERADKNLATIEGWRAKTDVVCELYDEERAITTVLTEALKSLSVAVDMNLSVVY